MSSANVIQLSSSNFSAEVMQSQVPVLVDFWAEWCGPCKMIAPMLDEIADGNVGKFKVAKVNIDSNQDLANQFNVRAIPTLLVIKGGAVKEQMVGAVSKKDLLAKITAHL